MGVSVSVSEVIKSSRVIIHKGRYAYLQVGKVPPLGNHFLMSKDKDEVTIITEEKTVPAVGYERIEKWFTLIEIKVSVPFLPGFVGEVTSAFAAEGLNALVVSTFSKEYLLTREEHTLKAVQLLKKMGFQVKTE